MHIDTASPEELKRLIGLERPSAIKRYLTRERIPFMEGADGWPRVLYVILLERLGAQVATFNHEPHLKLRNG